MKFTETAPIKRGDHIVLPLTPQQLSLADTLDCGQAFRWRRQEDGSYKGVVRGRLLHISRTGDELLLHNTTEQDYTDLWQEYFDMERSYGKLKERFSTNPVLRDAMGYAPGIRVLRQDPWETLCTFIISANNNIPRIKGIVERMSALFGQQIEDDYYSFPTPQRMATLCCEELAPLRCGYRDKFLLDAAQKVSAGEVSLDAIAQLPTHEAQQALRQIKGVGPKVADCILLFAYGRSECFPMDTWMKKVMTVLYPDGLPEDFLPSAGIAQQYLFHYARHHGELFD
ncbi:MAG: DNA glycosylase [Angelakisella sp.]